MKHKVFLALAIIALIFCVVLTAGSILRKTNVNEQISTEQVIIETESRETVTEAPTKEVESITEETEPSKEVITEVPLYNQLDYTNTPYGNYGTVRTHGCGITCLSMVATYLLDDWSLTPDVLAERFGQYNCVDGSSWALFADSAEELGLGEVTQAFDWSQGVEDALKNGQLVITNQRGGPFTKGGHYILLTGITEDGKVLVNDPNGANYTLPIMQDGFENGFKRTWISTHSACYWIYEKKNET